jgi:hypothetical protein
MVETTTTWGVLAVTVSALGTTRLAAPSLRRHHAFGFWAAAAALLLNMAFSAAPTPLYVLYQRRDHFSTITVTLVYSVYAVAVVVMSGTASLRTR